MCPNYEMLAPDLQTKIHTLYQNGAYDEVISLAISSGLSPGIDPISSRILAAAYFNIGEYSNALPILIPLESSFGHQSDFLSLLAATYRRIGDLNNSLKIFRKALDTDPENSSLKNNYGNLLVDLNRLTDARDIFQDLVKINPNYQNAMDNLTRVKSLIEKQTSPPEITPNHLDDLKLQDPLLMSFNEEEIEFSLSRYLKSDHRDKRTVNINELPDPAPRDVALDQLNAARLAIEEGNYLLTLKICSQVLKILPTDSRVYEYASDAYLNLEKFQQAELCLLHSLLLGGDSLKHYFNLVSFACMRNDLSLAHYYLGKAELVDPTSKKLSNLRKIVNSKSMTGSGFIFSPAWSQVTVEKK